MQKGDDSDVMATSEDDRGEPSKKRTKRSQMEKCEDEGGGGTAPDEVHERGPDKVSGVGI